MLKFSDIIDHAISVVTVIIFLLFAYSWWKNKSSRKLQFLTLYFLTLLTTHFVMFFTAKSGINNLFVSHYYFGLQFLFLGLFYKTLFTKSQKKWVNGTIIGVFTILTLYYVVQPEKYFEFNLIDIFITNVPLLFFSLIHLYNMLTAPTRFFTMNAAVLMYLSTTTLIFFLGTYLMVEGEEMAFARETALNIWTINNIMYLAYLIFFVIEWKKTFYKWQIKNS